MAQKDYRDRLAKMNREYADSKNQHDSMFGGVTIDEGQYVARLKSASIRESKSSGKLMIRREHLITEGKFSGFTVYDNMQIETPMGFVFIRRWIDQCGYEAPKEPEELIDICEALADDAPVCKIQVSHSGDFVNVRVLEVLDSEEEPEEPEETEEEEPEEEPEETEEEEEPESENSELFDQTIEFCKAQDVDFDEDDDLEILKERIGQWRWKESEMSTDEVSLFENLGLSDRIKKETRQSKPRSKPKGRGRDTKK